MKRVVVLIMSVGVVILLISTKGLSTKDQGLSTKYQGTMYQGTMYQGAMYQVGRDNGTGVSLSSAVGVSSLGRYAGGMQASYYGGADAALHGSTNGMKQGALGVSPLTLSSDASVKSYVSGGSIGGVSSAVSQHSGGVAAVGTGGGSAFSATAYTVPFAAVAVGGGVTIAEDEAGRAKRGALGGGTGGFRPGYDREDPYDTPIGDLPVVMVLVLAIGYAIVKRKKSTKDRCTMYEGFD